MQSIGGVVMCRALKQKGMHTFHGMLGYVMKDMDEIHYQNISHNVTAEDLSRGFDVYSLFGGDELKHRISLTTSNIFDRAFMYWKFHLKHPIGNDFLGTIHNMIRTGKYYPSSSWITPHQGRGMPLNKINALWNCMVYPKETSYNDVKQIFVQQDEPRENQPRIDWFNSRWKTTNANASEKK